MPASVVKERPIESPDDVVTESAQPSEDEPDPVAVSEDFDFFAEEQAPEDDDLAGAFDDDELYYEAVESMADELDAEYTKKKSAEPVQPEPVSYELTPEEEELEYKTAEEDREKYMRNYGVEDYGSARRVMDRKNRNARLKRKQWRDEAKKRGITIKALKATGWSPSRKIMSDENIAKRNTILEAGREKNWSKKAK